MGPAAISKVTNFKAYVFANKRASLVHFLVLFIGFFLFRSFVISMLLFECEVSLYFSLEISFQVELPLTFFLISFFFLTVVIFKEAIVTVWCLTLASFSPGSIG
jgi:hypothetical protein